MRGRAFLALWNDVDLAWAAEYEAWHAGEHVPERVGVEGFLAGRRAILVGGAGARYFTLYELDDLAALEGPAYADVLENPTAWSRRLRPALRNVVRRACATLASAAVGPSLFLLAAELVPKAGASFDPEHIRAAWTRFRAPLLGEGGITGVHLGLAAEVAPHPLQARWNRAGPVAAGSGPPLVLVVEGTSRETIAAAGEASLAALERGLGAARVAPPGLYEVVTSVERRDLSQPLPSGRQPPRPDLQARWLTGSSERDGSDP